MICSKVFKVKIPYVGSSAVVGWWVKTRGRRGFHGVHGNATWWCGRAVAVFYGNTGSVESWSDARVTYDKKSSFNKKISANERKIRKIRYCTCGNGNDWVFAAECQGLLTEVHGLHPVDIRRGGWPFPREGLKTVARCTGKCRFITGFSISGKHAGKKNGNIDPWSRRKRWKNIPRAYCAAYWYWLRGWFGRHLDKNPCSQRRWTL